MLFRAKSRTELVPFPPDPFPPDPFPPDPFPPDPFHWNGTSSVLLLVAANGRATKSIGRATATDAAGDARSRRIRDGDPDCTGLSGLHVGPVTGQSLSGAGFLSESFPEEIAGQCVAQSMGSSASQSDQADAAVSRGHPLSRVDRRPAINLPHGKTSRQRQAFRPGRSPAGPESGTGPILFGTRFASRKNP